MRRCGAPGDGAEPKPSPSFSNVESPPYAYLTVSYAKDLPGVVRLRESLRRVGETAPHHIVVHAEDHAAFQAALAGDEAVVLRSTADVLPEMQEHARRLRVRRDRGARWKARWLRLFAGAEQRRSLQVRGWHYQQLSKFYAAREMPSECVVILDSDIVALAKPEPAHFLREGRCILLEQRAPVLGSEQYRRWLAETRACLGLRGEGDEAN